jgi:hypothetical protein
MTENLTDEQLARAEALRQARAVLRGPGIAAPIPDVTDVHSLAVFILDGGDPWAQAGFSEVVDLDEGEGAKAHLSYAEHYASGGGHGFVAHEGIEIRIDKREGAEPTCEVKHDGKVLFRGGDGSAARSNLLRAFDDTHIAPREVNQLRAELELTKAANETLRQQLAEEDRSNDRLCENLVEWRRRALDAETAIATARATGGQS